ncbi:sulfotransferase domain-containing protein [Rubrivirga sp. IMCC45206]|uniref:sulfotransferase domain-containing protein n=1 Tax=Rubrivirga sp. IMCC45206 TaxID=3391614 RepID=UPI00398FEF64
MSPITIARKALRYGTSIAGLRASDVVVASFPKSGSTWVRFVLGNLAAAREGLEGPLDYARLDALLPEFGKSNLLTAPAVGGLPRFVKTHNAYWWPFARAAARVVVVRDPLDTMVSFYQFEQGKVHSRFRGAFSDFIRQPGVGLEAWFEHTRSWRARDIVEVHYETLKADDGAAFEALAGNLGLDAAPDEVAAAVERSRFDRVKQQEAASGLPDPSLVHEGFEFAKAGRVGRGAEWVSDADRAYFETLAARYGFRH